MTIIFGRIIRALNSFGIRVRFRGDHLSSALVSIGSSSNNIGRVVRIVATVAITYRHYL